MSVFGDVSHEWVDEKMVGLWICVRCGSRHVQMPSFSPQRTAIPTPEMKVPMKGWEEANIGDRLYSCEDIILKKVHDS